MVNKKLKIKKIQQNSLLNSLFKSKNFYGELFNNNISINNFPFIYGVRHSYAIINLKYTIIFFKRALKLIKNTLKSKQNILVIGNTPDINFLLKQNFTKKNNQIILFKDLWINGLLTNKKITNYLRKKEINLVIVLKTDIEDNYLFKEIKNIKIPVISLVDTSSNIQYINYPIFTNLRNTQSLFFLMYLFRKII